MYFHQQRRERSRALARGGVIGVLLVVVLVAFAQSGFLTKLSLSLGAPFMKARTTASTGATFAAGMFGSKGELVAENLALKEEMAVLRLKADLYDHARAEYDALRLLASGLTPSTEHAARVIASPGVTPYDVLIIDIGEGAGVKNGAIVFSDAGVALGFVETVAPRSARVALFSSPGAEEGVSLSGSAFRTIAKGQGGGVFVLEVPKEITVTEGELVTRVGTPDVLARVVSVDADDTDPFQTVRATTPVNIYELSYVVVADDVRE